MINKKQNLSLKLNKSLGNIIPDGPFTPLDQTLKTPLDCNQQANYFQAPPKQESIYSHPHYNESDDVLTDIDEPTLGTSKTTQQYTLNFTSNFDQLVMSVYSHILSLPTTTPFLGTTPPSGLVSKVANETMSSLIMHTASNNLPAFDQQSIITNDYLKNNAYQPIFLQLIRKRLIELCAYQNSRDNNINKLPNSTTVSITVSGSNGAPYNNNIRQTSISNLSLTDLNISNYNSNSSSNNNLMRSRSSSLNLRKQSLTRNNSCNGTNWLHVGNINNIRQQNGNNAPMQNDSMNVSSESLQSMQDYVPQSFITRSAGNTPTSSNNATTPNNGFNSMMMGYQTPPNSNKSSVSSGSTISSSSTIPNQNIQIFHNNNGGTNSNELDYFNFSGSRSRSASRSGNSFPGPLTINTDNANFQALNSLNGCDGDTLDSPFMSATTPSEEFGYFNQSNGFPNIPVESSKDGDAPSNSAISSNPKKDSIHVPSQFGLSEKKRDSLKLKRGIH